MKKFTAFIPKRKYWLLLALIALLLVGYWYFSGGQKAPPGVFGVTRGEVKSEVSVTGKVKPAQSLDLALEKAGRIQKIYVKVGDQVNEGELLLNLDNSDIYAQLLEAEASIKVEEAKLKELKSGTRPEDIRVKESELAKAQQDLVNYYDGVSDVLSDAYAKADNAVRQQTDQLFINDEEVNPRLTFQAADSQVQIDVEYLRRLATIELDGWQAELGQLAVSSSPAGLDQAIYNSKSHLTIIRNFLDKTMEAVIGALAVSQTTTDTYKTNLNTARTNVNASLTNVGNEEQAISSQKITVQKIQDELNLKLAGTVPEQIAGQEAKVDQAKASAEYYRAQIAKTILKAPFAGLVTKVDFDPGDIVSANTSVVSLIGRGTYQIESNIAESDIAKVKIGNWARVTLDAYGPDLVFEAKVIKTDLSATILEGVATYKTTLEFLKEDSRILAGLTANLEIINDKKENVLYVPTRNIITEDSKKFVKILKDEKNNIIEQMEIKTGLRGSDGRTEILSGLREGDKIVTD